jgi:hypothetical protein
MRQYHLAAAIGFGLLTLAACAAQQREASWQDVSIPPLQPNLARVWVLRMPSEAGVISGADPMVYANGKPLAQSTALTVYYHDFPPGTYHFTVQAYGTPANLVDIVTLAPGTDTYVQVQAVANWQMGSTAGGASFAVMTMAPQEAEPYLPTMKYLGER